MALPPIPPEVLAQAASWAKKGVVTIVAPTVWGKLKKFLGKDRGSKVKRGAFQECSIEKFGNKACIVADEDSGAIVLLTSDTIQSWEYVKKDFKVTRGKAYYYYEIKFREGQKSYVRMSEKYRDAMMNYL